MKLNNFDTVLIEFVYKEQLNKPIEERDFKYRPALILNKNLILEVVQISSKVKKYKKNKNCYVIKDLKAAGLDKPSLIRFNIKLKLADIDQKTIKKIGHLAEEDIKAIKEAKLVEKLQEAQQQSAVKSNGVYSVMKDDWIKEPVQADIPDLDEEAFDKLFTEWEDKYFDLLDKLNID